MDFANGVVFGLYEIPLRGWPLFAGCAAGMITGTWCFILEGFKPVLTIAGVGSIYIAIVALALNLAVSFGGSRLLPVGSGRARSGVARLAKV